jgi:hypothetical protein
VISQTPPALTKISLFGSSMRSAAGRGSLGSSAIAHNAICVSSSNLTRSSPGTTSSSSPLIVSVTPKAPRRDADALARSRRTSGHEARHRTTVPPDDNLCLGAGLDRLDQGLRLDPSVPGGWLRTPGSEQPTTRPPSHCRLCIDPFERMVVAQALHEPLRLMTHDPIVAAYSDSILLF